MASTSNYGWPKPALTDQPNGPAQIGAFADAADATVKAVKNSIPIIQRGSLTVSVAAANTPSTTHVTFPTAFAGVPTVMVGLRAFFPSLSSAAATSPTTTGFDLIYERTDTSGSVTADWTAIYN